jgi:hypothetical protein
VREKWTHLRSRACDKNVRTAGPLSYKRNGTRPLSYKRYGTRPLSYRRNGMSIFVLLLYSGYALGKVAARFRSSTIPQ